MNKMWLLREAKRLLELKDNLTEDDKILIKQIERLDREGE